MCRLILFLHSISSLTLWLIMFHAPANISKVKFTETENSEQTSKLNHSNAANCITNKYLHFANIHFWGTKKLVYYIHCKHCQTKHWKLAASRGGNLLLWRPEEHCRSRSVHLTVQLTVHLYSCTADSSVTLSLLWWCARPHCTAHRCVEFKRNF